MLLVFLPGVCVCVCVLLFLARKGVVETSQMGTNYFLVQPLGLAGIPRKKHDASSIQSAPHQ